MINNISEPVDCETMNHNEFFNQFNDMNISSAIIETIEKSSEIHLSSNEIDTLKLILTTDELKTFYYHNILKYVIKAHDQDMRTNLELAKSYIDKYLEME